jgi:hypothetical protein
VAIVSHDGTCCVEHTVVEGAILMVSKEHREEHIVVAWVTHTGFVVERLSTFGREVFGRQ